MGQRKHGWEWTAWMLAAVFLLGLAEAAPGEPLLPEVRLVQAGAEEEKEKRHGTEEEGRGDGQTAEASSEALSLHSLSAVLMDGETGRVLYGKDADVKRPMASTTKIMTCILALEHGNPGDLVEVSGEAASQPQVRMGMKQGEAYRLKDLLYALMLESYNDAAVAIAEHIGGSVEGFAGMMNEKAESLGCRDTYFITPNGLDAQEAGEDGQVLTHSTTARDLARIMAYCVLESPEKETFLEITRTRNKSVSDVSGNRNFSCANHNAMLDMDSGLLSGKTGFTGGAGYSYVAAAKDGDRVFTIALLGCGWPPDKAWKWSDAKKLLAYGREHYTRRDMFRQQEFTPVTVADGIPEGGDLSGTASLPLYVEKESLPVLAAQGEEAEILIRLPDAVKAPVRAGETVGEAVYVLDGLEIGRFPIRAGKSVERIGGRWCAGAVLDAYFLSSGRGFVDKAAAEGYTIGG